MSEADWSSARFAEILAQKRLRFLSSHPVQKQLLLVLPARSADRVTEELGGLGSLTCLLRTELEIAQEQLTVLVALEPAATSWCVRAVSDCSRLRTAFEEALREGTERLCDIPNPNTTRSGPLARFALGGKLASRGPKRNRRNL
ncbi:MAG: hypothetical protein IT384_04075 [Deltaproteobacteria bacterium]|nr:hypothetical protein [Deltaproteobacteria bacterium]